MSNHIGQVRSPLAAPTTAAAPYSAPHEAKVHQEEFEKSLETPMTDKEKKGWDAVHKQFDLSIFQMEHGKAMAHDARMKQIYDDMNDSGKSKSKSRHS